MRTLRNLSMAATLTLMLATGAFAGIIGSGPEPPPQPPSATAPGITETPPSAQAVSPVIDVALNLLQSALTLF